MACVSVGEFVSVVGDPAWLRFPASVSFDPTGDRVFLTGYENLPPKGLFAYRSDTGQLAWSLTPPPGVLGSIFCPPSFDATGSVVALTCGRLDGLKLVCLAVESGAELSSIGQPDRLLPGSAAFSPDGQVMAYRSMRPGSGTEGLVTVCDAANPSRTLWSKPNGSWGVSPAANGLYRPSFSFDSALLGLYDQSITAVYRSLSGDPVRSSQDSPGFGGAFSADGTRLIRVEAAPGRPAILRQFDIGTGREVQRAVMNVVGSADGWIRFSPDRRLVAISAERAAIFDVGATEPRFGPIAPWTHPIQFSPGGSFYSHDRIIESEQMSRVSLFRTETGEEVWHANIANYIYTRSAFSPDGRYFAVAGVSDMAGAARRGVFIVTVGDPPALATKFLGTILLQKELPSRVTNVAVGPGAGAPFVATTIGGAFPDAAGQELWVVGADQGEVRRQVQIRGVITGMDHSDDLSCVAVGSSDRLVRIFGTVAGGSDWIGRHDRAVNSVAVAADGGLIATGGSDRRVRVYARGLAPGESPDDHRPQWTSDLHAGGITRIAMSPNGKWLAAACSNGSIQLYNVASPEITRALANSARVTALVFASDKMLAVGLDKGESGSVLVFDAGSGVLLADLAHPAPVTAVCFNWDASLLATATGPDVLRIRRTSELSETPMLSLGFGTAVSDLVFCPVNNILIAALSADNVAVIDADTGDPRSLFTGAATGVRFASDGSLLVVAAGTTVTIYRAASAGRTRER